MSSNHDSEAVPLVIGNDDSSIGDFNDKSLDTDWEEHIPHRKKLSTKALAVLRWNRYGWFILLQLLLVLLYATTSWALRSHEAWHHLCKDDRSLVYSPAQTSVRYRKQRFDAELVIESDFIGDPTPESDDAWKDLIQNMNIAVPASDLERLGTSSIRVPDEPGMYVAGLSVFHELHCLKRLRQFTWIDHYFPNQTVEETRLHRLHTDHCIDVLRQAILCHADVSLFTLQWSESEPMPRADFSHEHQCVDWDTLNSWAAKRAIADEKMAKLQHPLHGSAFPSGEGSRLGASEDHSATVHENA